MFSRYLTLSNLPTYLLIHTWVIDSSTYLSHILESKIKPTRSQGLRAAQFSSNRDHAKRRISWVNNLEMHEASCRDRDRDLRWVHQCTRVSQNKQKLVKMKHQSTSFCLGILDHGPWSIKNSKMSVINIDDGLL